MRDWLTVVVLAVSACGCVESQLDERSYAWPPVQGHVGFTPPVDDFWLHQAIEERTRPPLVQAQSVSLGYIGDTPLSGGVMRDTPMPSFTEQQAPTCSCPRTSGEATMGSLE